MQKGSNVRNVRDSRFSQSVALGHQQQTLQIVGRYLIENHLDVELVVQSMSGKPMLMMLKIAEQTLNFMIDRERLPTLFDRAHLRL